MEFLQESGESVLPAIYVIMLEAAVTGLTINRTLCSRSRKMWHLPLYILIKTAVCALVFALNGIHLITALCTALSFAYAMICFNDRLTRKLFVVAVGLGCITMSNLFKFYILSKHGLTQSYNLSEDVLASVICIAYSVLLYCAFTIIATNIICRVRFKIVAIISAVSFLVLAFCDLVYRYMHSIVDVKLNSIFTVYALFFLLPAIVLLYFFEAVIFSHRDNFFKK